MPASFPLAFPVSFTGTSVKDMRQLLSKEVGDVIFGSCASTTTANGASGGTTIIDSTLAALPSDWFRTGTGGEQQTAIKITSGTYIGQVRYVSSFTQSTGTVTVSSAFGGQIVSGVTYEVHRFGHPAMKDDCIERGAKDAYPYLYDYVDSTAITFGDNLIDGSFESWSDSTTPGYWTASSTTTTRTSSYYHDSEYGMALSTTTGYVGQSSSNNPDLLMCGGATPTFYCWCKTSTASQVRLAIYDGTTTTYSDYHTGSNAWELLSVTATIADNPTDVAFRIYYASTATTAYVDDAVVLGGFEKYDYDIEDLELVNDTPDQVYYLDAQSATADYPRPLGLSVKTNDWTVLPNGKIRFLKSVGNGTRLRITGRKYLSTNSATAAAVAAGATFLDLTDTDDTSYTGKATYIVQVNAGETGLELAASAASQHKIGSSTAHAADTWANFIALISDETPMSVDSNLDDTAAGTNGTTTKGITTNAFYDHNAASTGVHGAAANTLMNTGDHLDDTAGGTNAATTKGITSNVHYDHCQNASAHTAAFSAHDGTATAHSCTGAVCGTTNTQTLTNKTLTTPIIASFYQDAGKTQLMTTPNTASDTLAAIAATQTLTNKTLSASVASGTWTSSNWVIPTGSLGDAQTLAFGDPTYWGAAIVPAAIITEDWETSTLFDAAAVSDTKAIWTSPAGCMVCGIKMRLVEQFAGAGLTDLSIIVGVGGGDADGYLADSGAMNLTSDALNSVYYEKGAEWDASGWIHFTAATTFTATATATGCNLADLTAGTVTFQISYIAYGSSLT